MVGRWASTAQGAAVGDGSGGADDEGGAACRQAGDVGGEASDEAGGYTSDDDSDCPELVDSDARPRPRKVLIVFAGPVRPVDGLAAALRRQDVGVVEIDIKIGGIDHNVLRAAVARGIEQRVAAREFGLVFLAVPCESFSVAHRPQLRSRGRHARGLATVALGAALAHWADYLAKHNRLADWAAWLARIADEAGIFFLAENPADCGDETSVAWWARFRTHAPLWVQPAWVELRNDTDARLFTFAQCAFRAQWRKLTTLMVSRGGARNPSDVLLRALASIVERICVHADPDPLLRRAHESVAWGRSADGVGNASQAAAYPADMNEYLARAIVAALLEALAVSREEVCGGCVADGPELSATVAAYVEGARGLARRFSSPRNLVGASLAELAAEAMPVPFAEPVTPTRPAKAKAQRGRPLPVEPAPTSSAAGAERPAGPIHVSQLFLEGVYEGEYLSWLPLVWEAVADVVVHGRAPRAVPTRVISQARMPVWARGDVWDCANPDDCVPVERSDRHFIFPGPKQLDRVELRKVADALGWPDADILGQAGEGGLEARSEAALTTTLSFHHKGLWAAWQQADELVRADIRQHWVTPPVAHLAWVPARVLPRNIVFAERTKVGDNGALVRFQKPRVSQDSSDGQLDSVNGGVPTHEKFISLPAAQQHARGAAIASTACGGSGRSVGGDGSGVDDPARPRLAIEGYAIDAKSAFRYCPLQRADVWTQCFVWWEWRQTGGGLWVLFVGICCDTRLAFGGAYSPNRFQRITCLVMAYIQSLQIAFDLAHPPPLVVQAWCTRRRELQAQGLLPGGEAQARPAGGQNYIDDFTGWGLNDPVSVCGRAVDCVCGAACHIVVDDEVMRATGGRAAAVNTRIHAHARLAIVGLRRFGLEDAPEKTVVGDPLGSLGLRVDVGRWRLDCPSSKRDTMLADGAEQLAMARVRLQVDQRAASTLVGRFCNLTQIFPELQPSMHGGYAVVGASWTTRSRGRSPLGMLQLRRDSRAHLEWCELLEMGSRLLLENSGVNLAPAAHFPSRWARGSITTTSDASGIDGVGGYLFAADEPGHVWILARRWPADIQAALDAAALPRVERAALPEDTPMLSMPAAELFGMVAMTAAGRQVLRPLGGLRAVTAIGDCAPAAAALNAATSPKAQLRRLLNEARTLSKQWLALAVPREANLDADRLSHPRNLMAVMREAAEAGLRVHEAPFDEETLWGQLRQAAALGLGVIPQRRRRQRRRARQPGPVGSAGGGGRRASWAPQLVSDVFTYHLSALEAGVKRLAAGADS